MMKLYFSLLFSPIRLGKKKLDIVMDGTPESFTVIKSGYVRIILDEHGHVKYPPLLQD